MKNNIDAIYMVHDELLYELFNLKFDTIQYQIINGIPYLVNVSHNRTFEIGFRVRLDKKLDEKVESGVYLNQIDTILADDIIFSVEEELLSKYGNLVYSNQLKTRKYYRIGYGNGNTGYTNGQFVVFDCICPGTVTISA